MRSAGVGFVLTLAAALGACTPPHHDRTARDPRAAAQVQALALRELFVTRERARQLVLWIDPAERGPTFELLGRADATLDTAALATGATVPVVAVSAADLTRLFRAHPDGWAAFYRAYAGSAGLVELAPPEWTDSTGASVVVGRACGEHCFNAWRVTVRDGRVTATTPLRLPRS